MLQGAGFKVFQNFQAALNRCSEKPSECVITLTATGRQAAQTVVQSCRVTLCR